MIKMNIMLKATYSLIMTVIILFLSCTNSKKGDCNLLETYSTQHKYLEFVACKNGEGQTLKYSTYRVTGAHSEEVEKYLVENYGMGELRFTCCGWEPLDGKEGEIINSELMKLNKDFHLFVTMTGTAEKNNYQDSIYIEKDRSKIDYFKVTVSLVEI